MKREMVVSKTPWISAYPADWKQVPLHALFKEHKNKNKDGNEQNLLSLSYGNIIRKDINSNEGLLPESFNGYNIVDDGDIVLRLTDLQNDHRSLRTGLVTERGIITSAYLTLRKKATLNSEYYHYLLHAFDIMKVFYSMGEGIRQSLGYDELSYVVIPQPSLDEQHAIVQYLDSKCSAIDEAIERHKKIIEKLEEYRKSSISNIATKGLISDRKVKDSGTDWVPQIPSDWDIVPLKSRFSFGKGLSITKADLVEEGVPVLSYGQIHSKSNKKTEITNDLIRFVPASIADSAPDSLAAVNGFIFADTSEDLEGCGNCNYVDHQGVYGGYHTVILKPKTLENNKYLAYLFQTDAWRYQMRKSLTEVKVFSISQKILKETWILLPPQHEQASIVSYLEKLCEDVNMSIVKHNDIIQKLEEYRKSIIYNVVTGKKDCREVAQ